MKLNYFEAAAWAVGLALLGATGLSSLRAEEAHAMAGVPSRVDVSPPAERPRGDSLVAAAVRIAATDPFRLGRRPSPVPFRVELEGAPPMAPSPPKPLLSLRGVLGGPPWEALVEGFPGREGSVLVRRGDHIGALVVRRVTADTVAISGLDTTWTLTLKRVWP